MNTEKHEVIVVGAGPAGSTAAILLVQKGHDVLLIDKQIFPRDKVCGDAIPPEAIMLLNKLGMQQILQTAIEDSLFYKMESIRISSPAGYKLDIPLWKHNDGFNGHGYFVPRFIFDELIRSHAIISGAEFKTAKVEALLRENEKVSGVKVHSAGQYSDIYAKIVIGADGVNSVIKRRIGLKKHKKIHQALAIRAYVDDADILPHKAEFYLYKSVLPGYAWIFPLGDKLANVGLGIRLDLYHNNKPKLNLKTLLAEFLDVPSIKRRIPNGVKSLKNIAAWPLHFGSQKSLQLVSDGALLVGDAAGLTNPLTGGGIQNALISSTLAADIAHSALLNNDFSLGFLSQYEQRCHKIIGHRMWRYYLMQSILSQYPLIIDLCVRLGQNNIKLVMNILNKKNQKFISKIKWI